MLKVPQRILGDCVEGLIYNQDALDYSHDLSTSVIVPKDRVSAVVPNRHVGRVEYVLLFKIRVTSWGPGP